MKLTNNIVQLNNIGAIRQTSPIKNTISFGQTPPDSVELSEKAKFAKELKNNHASCPILTRFNEKETKWTMFKDSQMGSQEAFWAESNTGELYYIKYAKNKEKLGHIKSELLATKLYKIAGIQTPEIRPVLINGKIWAIASKFETDLKETNNVKNLHEAFAADAWLANWDSVLYGNTFEKNGKPIKIDNGGSLNYRAQGGLKPNFGDEVDEIISLVDGRNWESTDVYASISYQDLIKSFKKVCSISNKAILDLVKDETLANTLINRKNYMQKFLEKMEKTPYTKQKLVDYLKDIKENLNETNEFSSEAIIETLTKQINTNIKSSWNNVKFPSTKTITENLIKELKKLEKNGVEITQNDIIDLFEEVAKDGFEIKAEKRSQELFAYDEAYSQLFNRLAMIAEKTPQKENESISTYVNRIVKLREKRNQQLENFRIKNIKEKLQYNEELEKPTPRPLTQSERTQAIEELERQRKKDAIVKTFVLKKLTECSTDEEIYKQWQKAHLGAFQFSNDELQTAVMQLGGRYNSKHLIKYKCQSFEEIAEKDYKQEFENEPVYHWFNKNNPEKFVKSLPKVGEIYTLDTRHCCSTHKHYGEMDYGDHISSLNIKFIMHPKSESSRAYNLGYNQEVVYPAGEKFIILDKELVEHIDSKTGEGCMRWEIHMQEV